MPSKQRLKLDLHRQAVPLTQLVIECTAQMAKLEIVHHRYTPHIKVTIELEESQQFLVVIGAKTILKLDQTLVLETGLPSTLKWFNKNQGREKIIPKKKHKKLVQLIKISKVNPQLTLTYRLKNQF